MWLKQAIVRQRCICSALLLAIASTFITGAVQAKTTPTLEHGLLGQSGTLIALVRERGHSRVGVLKFLVQREGLENGPPQDQAGPLNTYAADRLEVALALSNPDAPDKKIQLIRDANSVAAKIKGATIRTKAGRDALFTARYRLAWGQQQVTPDVFLSGIISVDPNVEKMKVALVMIERSTDSLTYCGTFTTNIERPKIPELDESVFFLRGGFDNGNTAIVETRKNVSKNFPLVDTDAPVGLEIRYNNRPEPLEFRDGRAFIREPNKGDRVSFRLFHRQRDQATYAVVLKVNGENTLFRERFRDVECSKWILDRERNEVEVGGFQSSDNQASEFIVLSEEESDSLAMRFGPETGTISLTVFQEGKPASAPRTDEEEDVAAMLMSAFPNTPIHDAQSLKYSLRAAAVAVSTRGLIFSGEQVGQAVKRVKVDLDPAPVMSAVVVYRKGKSQTK
jgi:hypothetical protein